MSVLKIKGFNVIDPNTNKYPDLRKIFKEESWAEGLSYISPYGFALQEDGVLLAIDMCGNQRSCPPDRFTIQIDGKETSISSVINLEKLISVCYNAISEGQILERMDFQQALDELGLTKQEFRVIMEGTEWEDYDEE